MAEVLQPTSPTAPAAPVTLGVTPPVADAAPSQGQTDVFTALDTSKLTPSQQDAYKQMQGDYTRKTQALSEERKAWETERQRYKETEDKFKDLEQRMARYAEQERLWNQWTPFLQQVSQPGVMEKIRAVMEGRPAQTEQAPARTGAETVARLLQDVADDDYVTGAILNRGFEQAQNRIQQTVMENMQKTLNEYGQQAMQTIMQWVQQYQTLADQMLGLRFAHEYELAPKDGRRFDPQRVIDTARKFNITDLNAAYNLAYGQEDMQRATEAARQQAEAEVQRRIQEATEAARKEALLQAHNESSGFLPAAGLKLPEFKRQAPTSYKEAEQQLANSLVQRGLNRTP